MEDARSAAAPFRARFSRWQWMVEVDDPRGMLGLRAAFMRHLRQYASPASDLFGAELIFGELLGNVVRYAPSRAFFHLDWFAPRPMLHVRDTGPGFDYVPQEEDLLSEHGRGLALVSVYGAKLVVRAMPNGGTDVAVELPIERRADGEPSALETG